MNIKKQRKIVMKYIYNDLIKTVLCRKYGIDISDNSLYCNFNIIKADLYTAIGVLSVFRGNEQPNFEFRIDSAAKPVKCTIEKT